MTMIYAIALSGTALLLRYCSIQHHSMTMMMMMIEEESVPSSSSTYNTSTTTTSTPQQRQNYYYFYYYSIVAQTTIFIIFILKNSFVTLLASQHWSFITGVLAHTTTTTAAAATTTTTTDRTTSTSTKSHLPTPLDSDRWTTIIAGVGSLVATLCGMWVSSLLQYFHHYPDGDSILKNTSANHPDPTTHGLTALLICAAIIMMLTTICSDVAYCIANKVRPLIRKYHHYGIKDGSNS
jgi:hypothetical protein